MNAFIWGECIPVNNLCIALIEINAYMHWLKKHIYNVQMESTS